MTMPAEDPDLEALRAPACPHTVDYLAFGAGLIPLFISFRSSSSETVTVTVNGQTTSTSQSQFKDPVAMVGGGLALVLALVSLAFWKGTLPQKKGLRIGLTVAAALLGLLQLVVRSGLLT
ncbi:MAG: hypothetical protein U0441_27755 [Polyangiaceae bacterium]